MRCEQGGAWWQPSQQHLSFAAALSSLRSQLLPQPWPSKQLIHPAILSQQHKSREHSQPQMFRVSSLRSWQGPHRRSTSRSTLAASRTSSTPCHRFVHGVLTEEAVAITTLLSLSSPHVRVAKDPQALLLVACCCAGRRHVTSYSLAYLGAVLQLDEQLSQLFKEHSGLVADEVFRRCCQAT